MPGAGHACAAGELMEAMVDQYMLVEVTQLAYVFVIALLGLPVPQCLSIQSLLSMPQYHRHSLLFTNITQKVGTRGGPSALQVLICLEPLGVSR